MKKVLLVDDNKDILDPLSLLLEDEGYEVKTLSQGEHTYRLIEEFQPDLVVLDILMSGIDGREICKSLKNNEKTKKIPVIMMSAHPSAKASLSSYRADAFIAKPFDVSELLQIVEKYL